MSFRRRFLSIITRPFVSSGDVISALQVESSGSIKLNHCVITMVTLMGDTYSLLTMTFASINS